jgi:DNA-binding NarL/FixJ family response regulator
MIRLLIADEQKCVQAQILEWLATENGIVIVDTANNGKIALEKVEQLRPDVVIMDLLMPVMDGVSATQIIHQRYPEIKILVFSSSDRSDNLKQALAAGAKGYVLKDTTKEDLLFALYAVTRGSVYLGPKVWQEDKIFSSPLPQTKLHLERWTMWLAKEVICWWRTRSEQEPVAVNNILTVLQLEDNLEPNQIIRLLEQPPEEESLLELLKLRLEELKNRCQK